MGARIGITIRKGRLDYEASIHVEVIDCQCIETITCDQGIWEGYNIELTDGGLLVRYSGVTRS